MRVHSKLARLASIAMFFILAGTRSGFAAPIIALGIQGGAFFSRTDIYGLLPAVQPGWDLKFSLAMDSHDVFSTTTNGGLAFTGRFQVDFFSLESSLPQTDGNLYRAWRGMGPSLLAGLRSPVFHLPLADIPVSGSIEAGGGLRTTKYSGTGLVSANPALVSIISLNFSISEQISLGLAFPFEYAWKSGGSAIMFGGGATLRYRLMKPVRISQWEKKL